MSNQIIANLSFVGQKWTGLATYAVNLLTRLPISGLTLLAAKHLTVSAPHNCHSIPENLSTDYGKKGHLSRLLWTQFQLPEIYADLGAALLFSPVPEAPLLSNCRSVVVVHDLIPLRFPKPTSPLTYYSRYYVPQVLKQAQHVICNSQSTAEELQHFFQIDASKITPILLSHDVEHFKPLAHLSFKAPPYFLYLGRHDPYKNLSRLIQAFAALPDQQCELWIAGPADPRYTPELVEQAEEAGVMQRVKFLDYVSYQHLPVLLNQAIALVFPSLWEGFGFPALEAMACGTPVITSNLSALPEVTGDAAILIDPYNISELTAAMQVVLTDGAARSQLRAAGLARARHFSWEKTAAATATVLQRYL